MNKETTSQLPLTFFEDKSPTLENFIVPECSEGDFLWTGSNRAVVEVLKSVRAGSGPQFVFLWGEPGVGKTHLLASLREDLESGPRVPVFQPDRSLYAIDDVQTLSSDEQQQLFDLYNCVRAHAGTRLVAAADQSPKSFERNHYRQDLTSRFSWGNVFEVLPLSGEQKRFIISDRARQRGLEVRPEVLNWIENNLPRDMHSLSNLLNHLDRYAMASKRAITIPLIKECLLQRDRDSDNETPIENQS